MGLFGKRSQELGDLADCSRCLWTGTCSFKKENPSIKIQKGTLLYPSPIGLGYLTHMDRILVEPDGSCPLNKEERGPRNDEERIAVFEKFLDKLDN